MTASTHSAVLVAVMAAVTMLLRFLPFLVFKKRTPRYITYLGQVLPPAMIGMLVIYCLKDVTGTEGAFRRAGADRGAPGRRPSGLEAQFPAEHSRWHGFLYAAGSARVLIRGF